MVAMEELMPGLPEDVAMECLLRVSYEQFRSVRSVCKLWRRQIESPHFHRIRKSEKKSRPVIALAQAEPALVSSGPAGKYSSSGLMICYRLSILQLPERYQHRPSASATWHTLPPIQGLPHGLPLFCQIAAVEDQRKLVVVGGWDPETWAPSDGVHVYDFLTGGWRAGARMPGPRRSFFACSASATTVFVAGGHDEEKNALRSAMAYDVAEDTWVPLPDMSRERDECKGVFLDGRFHVIGGYCTEMQGSFGGCSETFEVDTWRWGPVEEDTLEGAACPRTCVAGGDGRVYMVREGHVTATEVGGKWREVAEVPEDATVAPQLVAWEDRLLLMGSGSHGGAQEAYLLEIGSGGGGNNKKRKWQKIDVPFKYSGHVQAACWLQI